MKFCTNCGNELNGEKFCPKCGAEVATDVVSGATAPSSVKEDKNLLGKIIAVVVVLGVLITGFLLLTSRSYEKVAKDYMKATLKGDAKKVVSLIPDAVVEYQMDKLYDGSKKEMIESLEEDLDEYLDYLAKTLEDSDADVKDITYEISKAKKMDEDEIEDICDKYKKADLKIKEGRRITIKMKLPTDGSKQTRTEEITAVKIGRSWYLIW